MDTQINDVLLIQTHAFGSADLYYKTLENAMWRVSYCPPYGQWREMEVYGQGDEYHNHP